MPGKTKAQNPEAKLQASVAKTTKERQLEDHVRQQAMANNLAKWGSTLMEKSVKAERKRTEEQVRIESKLTRDAVRQIRQQKLEELYHDDELRYEAELESKGLAYRRDRT
jgi:transglutaminase/protease-like cytokinesis protein 3